MYHGHYSFLPTRDLFWVECKAKNLLGCGVAGCGCGVAGCGCGVSCQLNDLWAYEGKKNERERECCAVKFSGGHEII